MEQILGQLSEAIILAVKGDPERCRFIPRVLRDLTKLEIRPVCLTVLAYGLCSTIYENREDVDGWESLLLDCLELGFRHLDDRQLPTQIILTHTEHHRGLVDVVFKSRKSDTIADFLHAWTTAYPPPEQTGEIVRIRTGLLVSLDSLVPFSPRLRRLVIYFIERAGYKGFKSARLEKVVELLDHLHLTVEEMGHAWTSLLLDVIRSSEGPQRLPDRYWECLVELAAEGCGPEFGDTDTLKITKSLIDAEEWGKLECWIGTVWMYPNLVGITEEELEHSMVVLFYQRPGAAQRLEQWMGRWSRWKSIYIAGAFGQPKMGTPALFQRVHARAHEAVHRRDAL